MASTDAIPVPRKNTAFRLVFKILDADGDGVAAAADLDTEVSLDGAAFVDATAEATEIGQGAYYVDLTADEMNADSVVVITKTSTVGAKAPLTVLYPESAGDYRAAVTSIANDAISAAAIANGAIDAATFAAGAIDAAAIADNAIDAGAIAADAITAAKIANGAIDAATFAAGAIDAAAIATNAIDADALAADAVTEIWAKAVTDAAAVPAATASVLSVLTWLFQLARNKRTQTATTETVMQDDGTTPVATSTKSDDGTTFTRGEYS